MFSSNARMFRAFFFIKSPFTVFRKNRHSSLLTFDITSIISLTTMKKYYVNNRRQSNGDHEVHSESCPYLLAIESKTYLGEFSSCFPAVAKAKQTYPSADGCKTCSPACHTR